jgi:hypothetical protein
MSKRVAKSGTDLFIGLREFNREFEGDPFPLETMHLELQGLFAGPPDPQSLDGAEFEPKR